MRFFFVQEDFTGVARRGASAGAAGLGAPGADATGPGNPDASGSNAVSIHPARRGQGYATRGLALALAELRALPDFVDSEIYLHCYEYNQASLRVMLKNGGRVHHLDRDGYHVRIPKEA